jgi:esterase
MIQTSHVVHVGDKAVHYVEWRPDTSYSSTILCLHGSCQTAHTWEDFAQKLFDCTNKYRIIAVDLRGHGDSSHCASYELDDFVNDLTLFVEQQKLVNLILIGMSLGGLILIRSLIKRTLNVSPSHVVIVDITPDNLHSGAEGIKNAVQESQVLDSFEAFVQWAHKFNPNRSIESLESRLKHSLKQLPDKKWTWKYDPKFLAKKFGGNTEQLRDETWRDLGFISKSTENVLLIRGSLSNITTDEAITRMAESLRSCHVEVAIIQNAGHSVQGDNPTVFTRQVLSFITQPVLSKM